jgi:hypothetical protein
VSACENISSSGSSRPFEQGLGVGRLGRGREDRGQRGQLALEEPQVAQLGRGRQRRRDPDQRVRARVLAAAHHRTGGLDDRQAGVARRVVVLGVVGGALDPDPVRGDRDLVAGAHRLRRGNARAVDPGAVVGAEIFDLPAPGVLAQPRVLARHPHVGDEDLAVRAATDDVLALGQLVAAPGVGAGDEHQGGHG